MPLYEYKCSACAHRFERIVKFSDAPLTTCPECGKDAIEQLISAPAMQFKGSGWYVTDYARKNSTPGQLRIGKVGRRLRKLLRPARTTATGMEASSASSASSSSEKTSGDTSASSAGDNGGNFRQQPEEHQHRRRQQKPSK